MSTPEHDFVEQKLTKLKEALGDLPGLLRKYQDVGDREIQELIRKAGIQEQIDTIKARTEEHRKRLQKQADIISGQISALQEIREKFHLAPIPEGITHMHGIELSPLDWQTRLLVMEGNEDTITALGGKKDLPQAAPRSKARSRRS